MDRERDGQTERWTDTYTQRRKRETETESNISIILGPRSAQNTTFA